MELRRGERSYTADTLEELHALYPDAGLWLIVGTDMLCTLERWYRPERILSLARVAALARNAGDHALIREHAALLTARFGAGVDIVDTEPLPVSSSQIREGLYHGTESWLPEGVFAYIKEKGCILKPDLDALRRMVAEKQPGRAAHIFGCEETAAKLARRWGADEEKRVLPRFYTMSPSNIHRLNS